MLNCLPVAVSPEWGPVGAFIVSWLTFILIAVGAFLTFYAIFAVLCNTNGWLSDCPLPLPYILTKGTLKRDYLKWERGYEVRLMEQQYDYEMRLREQENNRLVLKYYEKGNSTNKDD